MRAVTYSQIKIRKECKYIKPTGSLSHNPTSYLVQYLLKYSISVCNKNI